VVHRSSVEARVIEGQSARRKSELRGAIQVRLLAVEVVLEVEIETLGGELRPEPGCVELLGRADPDAALAEAVEEVVPADANG